MTMTPPWLDWVKRLQAISQNGLTFAKDPFDIERYHAIQELALEIMAQGVDTDIDKLRTLFAQEQGYATPKVDIRGVVFRDDALLLVKERSDGRWSLPGGWADVGESLSDNVVREIYEESGFRTQAVKLLAVYDRSLHDYTPPSRHHIYKCFFRCELLGGQATLNIEISDIGFFRQHELPPLSLGRTIPQHVQRMFAHYRHPEWPTEYD